MKEHCWHAEEADTQTQKGLAGNRPLTTCCWCGAKRTVGQSKWSGMHGSHLRPGWQLYIEHTYSHPAGVDPKYCNPRSLPRGGV